MKYIESEILTNEMRESNSIFLIITGDSSYDLRILKEIGIKYNGNDKILFNPTIKIQYKKGKSAFNSLRVLAEIYKAKTIICIIDGEYFCEDIENQLRNALTERVYEIISMLPIREAYLIECKKGNYIIDLYCIISGIEECIEQEIVRLIKLKLHVDINTSGIESREGKNRVKHEIRQTLNRNGMRDITDLIKVSGKAKLEEAFPNICSVLKKIEEDP